MNPGISGTIVSMIFLIMACATLVGCNETRFAALPGDHLEPCDVRWKGLWLPRAEPESTTAFFIDPACQFVILDQPKNNAPLKRTPIAVNFAHVNGKDYLVVADTALQDIADIKPVYGIEPVPLRAYFFARYVATNDRIDVYPVDSERVANQIIERKLDGTVSKTPNELHVFVSGDSAHMLEILRDDSIFSAKPDIEMVRSDLSVEQFERTAKKFSKHKKP